MCRMKCVRCVCCVRCMWCTGRQSGATYLAVAHAQQYGTRFHGFSGIVLTVAVDTGCMTKMFVCHIIETNMDLQTAAGVATTIVATPPPPPPSSPPPCSYLAYFAAISSKPQLAPCGLAGRNAGQHLIALHRSERCAHNAGCKQFFFVAGSDGCLTACLPAWTGWHAPHPHSA